MGFTLCVSGKHTTKRRVTNMGAGGVSWRYKPSSWINYTVVPHYKWFRYIWYDLVLERWETDGSHMPMKEVTVLRSRMKKKEIKAYQKLLKDDQR